MGLLHLNHVLAEVLEGIDNASKRKLLTAEEKSRLLQINAMLRHPLAPRLRPEMGYEDFCTSVEDLTTEQLLEQVRAMRAARGAK